MSKDYKPLIDNVISKTIKHKLQIPKGDRITFYSIIISTIKDLDDTFDPKVSLGLDYAYDEAVDDLKDHRECWQI